MNSPKITYLFGAGASAGTNQKCIPIGLELSKDIAKVLDSISELIPGDDEEMQTQTPLVFELKPIYDKLKVNLSKLSIEAMNHASVDTLAKKRFLSNPNSKDFNQIKADLSAYFSIKQLITQPDNRYDAFYASIIEEDYYELPKNMNIVSWNYDKQFEIAYSGFDNKGVHDSSRRLNIISKFSNRTIKEFNIFKLNGTAALLTDHLDIGYMWDTNAVPMRKKSFNNILSCYYWFTGGQSPRQPALSFAWEKDFGTETVISKSIRAINGTTILIIIGYSFPFFNRKIDKQILESINPDIVYVQDLNPNAVISKIKIICPKYKEINFEPYSNVDQFLIPFDF